MIGLMVFDFLFFRPDEKLSCSGVGRGVQRKRRRGKRRESRKSERGGGGREAEGREPGE